MHLAIAYRGGMARIASSLVGLGVVALSAGCRASDETPGPSGTLGAEAGTDAGTGAETSTGGPLGFAPSNIALSGIDLSTVGDLIVEAPGCGLNTTFRENYCRYPHGAAFEIVTQPGGPSLGVYVARKVIVRPGAVLEALGTNGFALVALETIQIEGGIKATPFTSGVSPGGFVPDLANWTGTGPGGGAAGTNLVAAGGASYCGKGGRGGIRQGGVPAAFSAPTYGNAELVPLLGGSAGGAGGALAGGSGGGAVQLVAGTSITIAAGGYVTAGGGGGPFGGAADSQNGSGAGSGGAILIEAETVVVGGTLAANGGGGGPSGTSATTSNGSDGQPSDQPASGGTVSLGIVPGGIGSAGADTSGHDGATASASDKASGGGGAAGRIRINTRSGAATITGVVSPSLGACATQGVLR